MTTLTLSQGKLATFLACQRRFQLRYLRQLPWPVAPDTPQAEQTLHQGQQFHQLLERHFLGLGETAVSPAPPSLQQWWDAFQQHPPPLPSGQRLPELSLTIPIGDHLLTGRFDLLIAGQQNGTPFLHIFDWKTGRPATAQTLRQHWQTRLYLALLAEGGQAIRPLTGTEPLPPEQIRLTYWYATTPQTPVTITYDTAWHSQNRADIQTVIAQIDASLTAETWPLTDEITQCRTCPYQIVCGRESENPAPVHIKEIDEPEWETPPPALEPHQP